MQQFIGAMNDIILRLTLCNLQQLLHILSQQFAVDDQDGVRDPVGMAGVRLEARIHIVTAAQTKSVMSVRGLSFKKSIMLPYMSMMIIAVPKSG